MDRRFGRRGNGYTVSRNLAPQLVPAADCKALGRQTRNIRRNRCGSLPRASIGSGSFYRS